MSDINLQDINDLIHAVTHSDLPIDRVEELFATLLAMAKEIPNVIVDEAASLPPAFWENAPRHVNCRSWFSASFAEPTDEELRALWGVEGEREP